MILIVIGVALVYISSVVMVLECIREKRKLLLLDWVVAFIPIVRTLYLMFKVDEWYELWRMSICIRSEEKGWGFGWLYWNVNWKR